MYNLIIRTSFFFFFCRKLLELFKFLLTFWVTPKYFLWSINSNIIKALWLSLKWSYITNLLQSKMFLPKWSSQVKMFLRSGYFTTTAPSLCDSFGRARISCGGSRLQRIRINAGWRSRGKKKREKWRGFGWLEGLLRFSAAAVVRRRREGQTKCFAVNCYLITLYSPF